MWTQYLDQNEIKQAEVLPKYGIKNIWLTNNCFSLKKKSFIIFCKPRMSQQCDKVAE